MYNAYQTYRTYLQLNGSDQRERAVRSSRDDLLKHAVNSPDYQPDAKRNGVVQPMLFTRGGEEHSYNIICMPGDDLYAGDEIEVFGQHWLVMEARADMTTHKTGKMTQCNQLFRFQNFTPDVVEYWGILDQSGYSSTVTGTNQMKQSEEQLTIYFPYNDDTAKIFVDKRLATHVGYEKNGRQVLATVKITSTSPRSNSYNMEDHLLTLKAIRDVYSESADNLDLMICDYIPPDHDPLYPSEPTLYCDVIGKPTVMLNRTRTLSPVFYQADGVTEDTSITARWTYPEVEGVEMQVEGNQLKIKAGGSSSLIGSVFTVVLDDDAGRYHPLSLEVEVTNFA